jgi:Tfp pilus assembly protein PilN
MANASFLPEDYLAQKAERRTNLISLVLFGVVMIAVVGAFFVTNKQARALKALQENVNAQCLDAGTQIEELKQLQEQEREMIDRAELASALVERVPRSILLAELINRMPERLSLLEFDMKSERVKAPAAAPEKDAKGRMVTKAQERGKGKDDEKKPDKIEPPRYKVNIAMTGVAPTDLEVSKYMTELNAYSLLRDVTLVYSEQKELDGRTMRQFKINLSLDQSADVRRINPLSVPRVKNPMKDDMQFNQTNFQNTASVEPDAQEGQ